MKRLKAKFSVRLDHLWPLVILAGLIFYVSLIPQAPNDFWWHLKIGERIATTGRIPTTNIYGWTLPADAPFTYGAWLAEYLFYQLYRLGGVEFLLFFRSLLALLTFGLVGYAAKRRSSSWRLAAVAVAFAGLMSLNNLIVRPQLWSWLPFMAYYLLLSGYARGETSKRWLWLCPVLMAFWVNVHGAFVLGPILLGIFLVGEAARTLLGGPGALSWRGVVWIAVILVATVAATAVNPQFVGIYGYVVNMMTDAPSQGLVVEWQSPTLGGVPNTVFYVSVLALLLLFAYTRHRPTPTDALLLVAFLWLAWNGQRYVLWFGFVVMPMLTEVLGDLLPARVVHAPSSRNWLNTVLLLLLWLPVLLVQPWFVEQIPLPETYLDLVWRDVDVGPLQGVETPVRAADYLWEHPGGNLYNEMGYGSYLIWAVPDQKVFVDPRVELYPLEIWEDYIRLSRGVRYAELFDVYGVDRVLLDKELQSELSRVLAQDDAWMLEYEDQRAQLWTLISDP